MSLSIFTAGMRSRYHYLKKYPNGNLILKMSDERPVFTKYIQEDYTPSFALAKSILIPSWNPADRKVLIWKPYKINDNASLYPKEVREQRIGRILLSMFGYSNNSKPNIDTILRKTKNAENDLYEINSDIASWEFGEYDERLRDVRKNYANDPNKLKYIDMLEAEKKKLERKKKSIKPKSKRKPVKKCRCRK